jgi:hypothetical protein
MHTTLGQPRLLGRTAYALPTILTKTLENGDFCISPEKVHSRLPRDFVGVRIDHQDFEFIAYRENALAQEKSARRSTLRDVALAVSQSMAHYRLLTSSETS